MRAEGASGTAARRHECSRSSKACVISLNRVVLNACTWNNEPSGRVCAHRPMTVFERTSLTPADRWRDGRGRAEELLPERAALACREAGLRHHRIAATAPVGTDAGLRASSSCRRPTLPFDRANRRDRTTAKHPIRKPAERPAMANGCLIALEGSGADRDRTCPCVSAADLVTMLMTPFTALAPHTVPPARE